MNVVSKINQMQEIVPDYVKVRYEDRDIANIFSLTNLVKKKGVTYESHQYDAFSNHTNRGIIKLIQNKQGLYVFNTTYTTANSIFHHSGRKYGKIHKQTNRELQVSQENIQ